MATLETTQIFDVDEAVDLAAEITQSLKDAERFAKDSNYQHEEPLNRLSSWHNIAVDFVREVSPRIENGKISPLNKIKLRMALIELELMINDSSVSGNKLHKN